MIKQQELVFGRFLERKRKLLTLTQAQLAKKLGYINVNKGIRRIAEIESGIMDKALTSAIMVILNVTEQERQKCLLAEELSKKRMVKKMPTFQPKLVWRALSCIHFSEILPGNLNSNSAKINYAQNFARERHRHCRLELNYNLRYYISPDGEISNPDRRFIGPCNDKLNLGNLILERILK